MSGAVLERGTGNLRPSGKNEEDRAEKGLVGEETAVLSWRGLGIGRRGDLKGGGYQLWCCPCRRREL